MSIFDVPLAELREPNELAHFGVKGMKWGRRKQRLEKTRAEYKRKKREYKERDRRAVQALNRASDAMIRDLSRSKISSSRTKRSWGAVDDYYYGNKPYVGRVDSMLLRARKGSRRSALGRARVINAQRKRATRVDAQTAWLDSRSGAPTSAKALLNVARADSAFRNKRRAGGVVREYRRQRALQKKGATYRKAEPQPWEKGHIGSRITKKYLRKY